jgi:cytochrome c peroxidase
MNSKSLKFTLPIALFLLVAACQDDRDGRNPGDLNVFASLSALPTTVQFPTDNATNEAKKELGRLLFYDPILSGTKNIACASCHHPSLAYADGRDLSIGVNGAGLGPDRVNGSLANRNSPTLLNTAFNGILNNGSYLPSEAPMFWDNRAQSLEHQALLPMLSKEEMRGSAIAEGDLMDTIIERLVTITEYQDLFQNAFGSNGISEIRILQAIATFERSLISNNSPFDQYMRGNDNALSAEAIEGMERFVAIGCAECHNGPMLSDYELHTLGVPDHELVSDNGATGAFDFRTPSLRNINLTGPYMHNGEFSNLREVLDFYDDISRGQQNAVNRNISVNDVDRDARDLNINRGDFDELLAFLASLTDQSFDKTIPSRVPSNLAVGGDIQ